MDTECKKYRKMVVWMGIKFAMVATGREIRRYDELISFVNDTDAMWYYGSFYKMEQDMRHIEQVVEEGEFNDIEDGVATLDDYPPLHLCSGLCHEFRCYP